MKQLLVSFILSGCIALTACQTTHQHQTVLRNAPSVGEVRGGINDAQRSNAETATHAKRVGEGVDRATAGVDRARTRAERIDAKAGVFLRYWGK